MACQLSIYHFITWSEIGYFKIGFKIIHSHAVFFSTMKLCGNIFVFFDRKSRSKLIFQCFISLK